MATSVKLTNNQNSHSNGASRHYKAKIETLTDKLPFISEETEIKINELVATVSKVSKQYMKVGRQYIKANPIAGLMVATGVGFVAGALFSIIVRKKS